jgi:hypothetical protein
MPLQIINPLKFPDWDELLLTTGDYSFFHSSSWARVLCESYKYKPLYFASIDNGKLSVLVPVMEVKSLLTGRRGVSLPFSDHCQLIVASENNCQEIIRNIIDYGKRADWKYIEWRDGENCFKDITPSSSYIGHTLALKENEQELLSGFKSSTRRNIKKAVKKGVEVGLHYSLESMRTFYRLNCITRKMHGLPPQPFYFFQDIHKHIVSLKKGFVVLATFNERPVAGAVYFHIGEKAFYKYGASDRSYQHLRANNLVMWEAIKWYARNGFKHFSFGRTEPENTGLLQFKQGWGPREEIINYYKYSLEKDSFVKDHFRGRTSYIFFKKLPSPLLNLIGFLFYRHVG